ncbi:MAG: exosortase [Pseudomonadota bacterium]
MSGNVTLSHWPSSPWRAALPALVAALVAVGLLYSDTLLAMASIWRRSETFAHAWLVPPIVLWLVWRLRGELALLAPRPAPWVLLPMAVAAFGWLLGDLAGINAVTQLAVTALLVLAVPAVLGLAVARRLMFPLAFLFFMVPIGEFTTGVMMEWTADFTVWALVATGVPVYREGLQFIIPSGAWSVVEACSGVRYLIASFMVGTLFAYLNYSSPVRRWVFVGISILVPIVANWVRAYMIVMLGHLSGNKLAVGVDHLVYGWVFFGVVIGIMFVIGARWQEPVAAPRAPAAADAVGTAAPAARVWPSAALAAITVALAPAAAWALQHPTDRPPLALTLPTLAGAPDAPEQALKLPPHFEGAAAQAHRVYAGEGSAVTVHVAYYRHQGYGAKVTSSMNFLIPSDDRHWIRVSFGVARVPVPALGSETLAMRAHELIGGRTASTVGREHLEVRQVYWAGGRLEHRSTWATAWGLLGRLAGRGDDAAMLTFYTDGQNPEAARRVEAFVGQQLPALVAHLEQVRAAAR